MSKAKIISSDNNLPTPEKNKAAWYSEERLQQLLEYYVGDSENVAVLHALGNEKELIYQLQQFAQYGNGNQHLEGQQLQQLIIPLNVNALNGQLSEDTNHWVGLYITHNSNGGIIFSYIDPMGRPINSNLQATIEQTLSASFASVQMEQPLLNRSIQFVRQISEVELDGNINDCGPMLVYAMACASRSTLENLPTINSQVQSDSFGAFLRDSFNRQDDFNSIYITAVRHSNNGTSNIDDNDSDYYGNFLSNQLLNSEYSSSQVYRYCCINWYKIKYINYLKYSL